jgi:hypothetical protein
VSETFTVPPGCQGLTIDGTNARYGANATGHVTIDNPQHAAKVRVNGAAYIHREVLAVNGGKGRVCPDCKCIAHVFSTACPRCSTDLTEVEVS